MTELLDKYLSQLNETLASPSNIRGTQAADICNDLSYYVQNVTESETAYCSSMLFNEENGVLAFMKKVLLLDEFAKCKEVILTFLATYIEKIKIKITPYAADIKDVCLSLFTRDKNSRVKNETFQVLLQLLELKLDCSIVEKLNIENMVEKYFTAILQPTKYSSTVKYGIYSLLGTLAEFFPEYIAARAERLLSIYVNVLKAEMRKASKPDMPVIAGCLRGLGSTLVNFTQSVDEGSPFAPDIYKFVRKSIDPKIVYARYEVPRAGLAFLAKHAAQYKEYLTKDYESVYDALIHWCRQNNKETRSNAFAALESFLKQVADCLVNRHENKEHSDDMVIFKFFIKTFQGIINSNRSLTRDISIAIRGYGYFAKPCKLFLKEDDAKFMLNDMIQKSEQMYFNDHELKEEKLQNLPSFLEALGFIVEEIDKIPHAFVSSLERLVIVLIEKYPELGRGPQFLCCKAMLKLFFALATKEAILQPFLSQIVYQGVIRTCSHPVVLDEGAEDTVVYEAGVRRVQYKDYMDLWMCFLDGRNYRDSSFSLESVALSDDVHHLVYNELVQAVIRITKKLDLTSFENTNENEGTAQNSANVTSNANFDGTHITNDLQPKAPKDFQIFINLVEFSRKIFLETKTEWFREWILCFGREMIVLCSRSPFVSGFYKMLEIVMKLSKQLNYFKGVTLNNVSSDDDIEMDVDQLGFSDTKDCFVLFHKFTKEVVIRMKQYKDDLMASCLQLILALPNELVMCDMNIIIPALKMAFKLGLSYLPLAGAALDALETWTEEIPSELLHPHLRGVLPYMDGYLKTGSELGGVSDMANYIKLPSKKSSTGKYKRDKKTLVLANENNPLNKVRHRILILLGKLGGRCNLGLLGNTEGAVVNKQAIAWDTKQHLSFAVPFQDMKPKIYLDPFLPRVIDLAANSSDRQTKVAASEVLHSFVLFMLGKSVQAPIMGGKSLFEKLWQNVFPVILQLACDVEQVCRQLFKPLLFQLIHWFTNNKQYESPDTIVLLETLLDGIVHPTDTCLRDLSAKCIEEFLRWSIKQTTAQQMARRPFNIKSLLKRLYSMACHPNANKRLGASLAFNNIYRVFREERSIVDDFTLELLVVYLDSLAMAHHDEKCLGTQSQCIEVLGHFERIIKSAAEKLNKPSKTRRVPKSFPEDSVTLMHLVPWLVSRCGRQETECRHQCMRLVSVLAPLLPGCSSCDMWMKNTLKSDGRKYFVSRFEGGFAGTSGILQYPTLSSISGPFSLTTTKQWFDLLLAALDCYNWVFGQRYLQPNDVLKAEKHEVSSVLFQSLVFFVRKLSLHGIDEAVKCSNVSGNDLNTLCFSPSEIQDYNRSKCTVIVRLIGFLTLLLQLNMDTCLQVVPVEFWNVTLFEILFDCICEPQVLGFNITDLEVMEKLPQESGELCRLLASNLPQQYLDLMYEALLRKISLGGRCNLFDQLPLSLRGNHVEENGHSRHQLLIKGYQQLHKTGILLPALHKQGSWTPEKCTEMLLESVFEGIGSHDAIGGVRLVQLTPTSHQLAVTLLQLAFDLGLKVKSLLECIENKTKLRDSKGSFVNIGMIFYQTFHTCIEDFFIKNSSESLPAIMKYNDNQPFWVSNTLINILEHVNKDKQLKKRFGREITTAILMSWDKLGSWWDTTSTRELKRSTVILMRSILMVDPKCLSELKTSEKLLETYVTVLKDKTITLTLKTQCLELLPCFTTLPDQQIKVLRRALDCLIADNFPLSSKEFTVGTPKYNEYIAAIDKMLSAMVSSGSLMLLDVLIVIICREENHSHEEKIQTELVKFMKRLNFANGKKALDNSFTIFKNDKEHRSLTRRTVVEKILSVFLQVAPVSVIRDFFVDNIKGIMAVVESKFTKTVESIFETQLVSKLCCFQLLTIMYSKLSKSDVSSLESKINKAYCCDNVKNGKELTMALTKCAHLCKSEDIRGETQLLQLRRQFHCSAYNALISVIACTQTEQKFYNGFLFSENVTKGQFLLENLVDCDKKYHFEMELTAPIDKRTQLTAIRRLARANVFSESENEADYGHSMPYIASQYLAGSSLSEEVSQFDFSTPIQAISSQPDSGKYEESCSEQSAEPSSPKERSSVTSNDVLEMDDINRHECMTSLIYVIKHLTENKIIPTLQKDESPKEMPAWMTYFNRKLSEHSTHVNVKLFIVKLVTNLPEIFQPYAKFWFSPLMEFLLHPDFVSEDLNYFVTDSMITMLSWSPQTIPEDSFFARRLTNRLLEHLMTKCNHPTRSIFKNNLEIIKTFVEVWKDRIDVPTKVIFEQFSKDDSNKKDNSVGIQLLGIILANKLPPYSSGCGVDRDRFFQCLVANLSFKYKEVHAAAAEVCGMALKNFAEENKDLRDLLGSLLTEKLSTISKDVDKLITCLHRLQVHYPPIVDRFVNKILFTIPSVHGTFKTQCFEIILSRVSSIKNVFVELKAVGFITSLNHRNDECQLACLRILFGLLSVLTVEQINQVMPSITAFSTHNNVTCRQLMFDILIWIYDTYRLEDAFKQEMGADEVLGKTKEVLLQGLADENKEIRLKLRNFWSDETRLPSSTIDRLLQVLRAMYSNNTESQFLSYTTNLLLQLTSQSPDFGREIFEQPLSECKFQEYPIDYSWQQRNSAMTPLFAATQTQSSSQTPFASSSLDFTDAPHLRATQQPQFTATQAPLTAPISQSYDWLRPSDDIGTQSSTPSFTATPATQSSLLFQSTGKRRRYKTVTQRPGLHEQMTLDETDAASSPSNSRKDSIMRLKRRFLKDRSGDDVFYAKQEIKRRKIRQENFEQQKKAQGNKVVMYRKYRDGELPDIQIKHSDLIAPLQALAQCDSNIAKQLFCSIFRGIFSQLDENLTEEQAEETFTSIQDALNTMLSSSQQFFPPFISCIQNICYNDAKLCLEPGRVTLASINSLQQPIGVMLLEKQILQKSDQATERPSKRHKSHSVNTTRPDTLTTWLELSKLYKSVGDFDVLRGIFTSQIGTQSITKEALEAEGRGDYTKALKLYSEASCCDVWPHGEPLKEEEDLWDDAKLECCRRLTYWDKMEECIVVNFDEKDGVVDLQQIWTDQYYQEHYLPFLLRCKTKQLSSGKMDKHFNDFVVESLKDEEKKTNLETRFSDLLSLFFVFQEDYDRARYYSGICLQNFLLDWSGLDSSLNTSRLSRLHFLQSMTEMQEFLDFVASEDNFVNASFVMSLLTRWSSREPDMTSHSVEIWDDIVSNRSLYMNKLLNKFKRKSSFENSSQHHDDGITTLQNLEEHFLKQRVLFSLRLSEAATQQINFPVAKKQLQNSLQIIKDSFSDEPELQVLWTHAYGNLNCKECTMLSSTQAFHVAMNAISQLDKMNDNKILSENLSLAVEHYILKSDALNAIIKPLQVGDVWGSLNEGQQTKLVSFYGGKNVETLGKVISQLTTKSFTTLQQAVKTAQTHHLNEKSADSRKKIISSLMTMAKFCDRILRDEEDIPGTPKLDTKIFPGIIIRYVLKSMTYESSDARQMFPRLLQLVESYPGSDVEAFIRKASDVPCWMFLMWINQMMALLDKKESKAVQGILQNIANHYPQALIFPLKISSEQFRFGTTSEEQENQNFVSTLKHDLHQYLPIVDNFVAALEQLTNPNMVFQDWVKEAKSLFGSKERKEELIRDSYNEMYQKLFVVATQGLTSGGLHMGAIRKRFAKEFCKKVNDNFGKDGCKLVKMTTQNFQGITSRLLEDMKPNYKTKYDGNLKDHSPWLSNFRLHNITQKLEIPGQYGGQSKPLPDYHVTIAGLDEKVLTMKSLRAPKRITILGNDEKEYKFLVKGGEDLRLDQRIIQLFSLMNDIMRDDAACHQRNLKLKTYKVIPMTSRIGVIEWLEQTTVFKSFFMSGLTETEQKIFNSNSGPLHIHNKWLESFLPGKNGNIDSYHVMFQKAKRTNVIRQFDEIQNVIPENALRRSFLQLSSCPEAFLMLRTHFARTYASLCVCQYILGIGDRHLSNIMIDLNTGGVIGIDFGHSFGSATQLLDLPELIPFRLTRQISHVMLPMKENGIFDNTMTYTLRALRHNHEILLNTMDVFVKEPSLDWQMFAKRQEKQQRLNMGGDYTWYPKQKIDLVKQKLRGDNPVDVMSMDLYNGHQRRECYPEMSAVLKGDAQFNRRAQSYDNSVENQVACLIDQATDPNILGRTWKGWEPWV